LVSSAPSERSAAKLLAEQDAALDVPALTRVLEQAAPS